MQRLVAFFVDLLALVAVGLGVVLGSRVLGAEISLDDALPLGAFLLVFWFLYSTVPLAFLGVTLGMAAAGLVARSPGNRPLTFRQSVVRWLCSVLTVALAGLPGLLALGGSSVADRASGSATLSQR